MSQGFNVNYNNVSSVYQHNLLFTGQDSLMQNTVDEADSFNKTNQSIKERDFFNRIQTRIAEKKYGKPLNTSQSRSMYNTLNGQNKWATFTTLQQQYESLKFNQKHHESNETRKKLMNQQGNYKNRVLSYDIKTQRPSISSIGNETLPGLFSTH